MVAKRSLARVILIDIRIVVIIIVNSYIIVSKKANLGGYPLLCRPVWTVSHSVTCSDLSKMFKALRLLLLKRAKYQPRDLKGL